MSRRYEPSNTPVGLLIENWVHNQPIPEIAAFARRLAPLVAKRQNKRVDVDHLARLVRGWRRGGYIPPVYRDDVAKVLGVSRAFLDDKIQQAYQRTGSAPSNRPVESVRLQKSISTALIAHRVQYADEPEFEQFLNILYQELPDIADTTGDLEWYAQNMDRYRFNEPPCEDNFWVTKFVEPENLRDVVSALLYSSYFPSLGFLFISYLAVDDELFRYLLGQGNVSAAREIRYKATRLLLEELPPVKNIVNGVLTEISHDEKREYRKGLFAGYANRLFRSRLYEVNIEYIPPACLIEHTHDPADLLYLPGERQQKMLSEYDNHLPQSEVLSMMQFIYHHAYGDPLQPSVEEARRAVLDPELARLGRELPEYVSLSPLRGR